MTATVHQEFREVPATASRVPGRRGDLALALQEVLTVVSRLRRGRTVGTDPEAFRENLKQWLADAARQNRRNGYSEDSIVLAGYAVVAFLDESVLNSADPMFSDWHRRPLQEELFGDFLGGERVFQNLEELHRKPDSEELADVLEVYLQCLALGFQGQYAALGAGGRHELRDHWERGRDRIVGIRGAWGDLSPSWRVPPYPDDPPGLDRVSRGLLVGTVAALALFASLWVVFFLVVRLFELSP